MSEWMDIPALSEDNPEKRIHAERYEYAASVLSGKRVLDAACGMGYGTAIMSAAGCSVTGIDIDPQAIRLADEKYKFRFGVADISGLSGGSFITLFDALVSFETLEHLSDPHALMNSLPENIADVIVSAPIRPTVGWNPWHKTDFTHGSLCSMVEQAGFRIVYVRSQPWIDGKGDLYLMVHGKRGNWTL